MGDIRKGKGFGYEDEGTICMIRCFECGRENWAMAVAAGYCAWCGHNPNEDKTCSNPCEDTDTKPA
jgi:hypothetical protein